MVGWGDREELQLEEPAAGEAERDQYAPFLHQLCKSEDNMNRNKE